MSRNEPARSRNEPARSRHRQELREQLSLRSIPLAEPVSYTLDNHFGWRVLQKCRMADGTFPPYLVSFGYCNKPEVPSRDDGGDLDKVMYVLYIRGQDGDLSPVDQETQTAASATSVGAISHMLESTPPPAPPVQKVKRKKSPERRKVISDFYYIPIKERLMARYDIGASPEDNAKGDVADTAGGRTPKLERGRTKPKGWQLRAGAESPDEETTDPETSEEDQEKVDQDRLDCTGCLSRSSPVELMESRLFNNRYLFLPKERYDKRSHVSGSSE